MSYLKLFKCAQTIVQIEREKKCKDEYRVDSSETEILECMITILNSKNEILSDASIYI